MDTDVLVVGAGPTGLMLANWLARLGVDHVVLDHKHGPTRESRALAVQSRSMEIYEQLGLVDRVRDASVTALEFRYGYARRGDLGRVAIGRLGQRLTAYPGIHILEQSANEAILLGQLEHLRQGRGSGSLSPRSSRHGGASVRSHPAEAVSSPLADGAVRWGTRVVGLEDDGECVHVKVETHAADATGVVSGEEFRARYVVGCDGAGSAVRELSGIPFSGKTKPNFFWVLDAVGVTGVSKGNVNVRFARDTFLLCFPMAGRRSHRFVGVMREGTPQEETIRRTLADTFGVTYERANWFSPYRLHYRVADSFRRGRVFVAGDAAHVHSPVGGQGMNTGLQDAHNLAFALAAVFDGTATPEHLEHYELERRPVARRLVRTTDTIFDAINPDDGVSVLRRRIISVLPVFGTRLVSSRLPGTSRVAEYLGQLRIHYWRSEAHKAAAGGRRDRVVGRRLPWTGANHACLARATWQVHVYSSGSADLQRLPAVVSGVHRFDPDPRVGLPEGTVLLVRPDGFVAERAHLRDGPDAIREAFTAALTELGLTERSVRDAERAGVGFGEPVGDAAP